MKLLGFALVVVGLLALAYGGIRYDQQKTVVDVGAFKATATEHKSFPVSPIVGVIAMLGGGLLLFSQQKKRTA
jgi:uncharacterized membrane protein YidH (DUF202 family)